MHARILALIITMLLYSGTNVHAEQSAELHLLLQGTERFQKNVLDLEAEVLGLEEEKMSPREGRISVHLNTVLAAPYRLEKLEIRLDNKQVKHHQYTASQRRALVNGATQPLYVTNLLPGKHRLEAHFVVSEGKRVHRGHSELNFEHTKGETWLELLLEDIPAKILSPQNVPATPASASYPDAKERRVVELTARAWEAPR